MTSTLTSTMTPTTCRKPAQRLAASLLSAWSSGDRRGLAVTLERPADYWALDPEERDVVELIRGIGLKMRDAGERFNHDEMRASLKLLRHFARF